jgi:hypothetical protein
MEILCASMEACTTLHDSIGAKMDPEDRRAGTLHIMAPESCTSCPSSTGGDCTSPALLYEDAAANI